MVIKLKEAGMPDEPSLFVKKTFLSSFYMTTALSIILVAVFSNLLRMLLFIFPVLLVVLFFYFIRYPDVRIIKKEGEIDKEIVFAGRFLLIELDSGVPLYNAMLNVARSYKKVGACFKGIIRDIDMGTTMEDALNKAIELTPSRDLRKILWQILNSLKTGADISQSLKGVIEQITKKQIIKVKEYGKKLNPLAMFYMMLGIIVPSLGITIMIILSTFMSIEISLGILMIITGFLIFIQFMFVAFIKASRPAVEM